jgi:hypothetical protein
MKKIKEILEPLDIITSEKNFFWVWFAFTVFAGQLGIIANIILKGSFQKYSILESIVQDSKSGNFYTYSIALFASTLGLLFVNFIERNPTKFKTLKIYLLILTIFSLFFAGIFYSSLTLKSISKVELNFSQIRIDWPQLIFLLLSILSAVYTFCITRLDLNYEKFKHLDDDYSSKDDENASTLDEKVNELANDKNGNKL